MKIKHAKSILTRKIEHWVKSVDDPEIQKLIKENAIVSGGAITSLLMGTKVNDYDIYFKTHEATFKIAEYYVKKLKENPTKLFTDNSISVNYVADPMTGLPTTQVGIYVSGSGVSDISHLEDDSLTNDNDIDTETLNQLTEINDSEIIGTSIYNLRNNTVDEENDDDDSDENAKTQLYRPVYVTSNAITLKNNIQIVIRFNGEIDEIHKNYDFTHCKCAYDFKNKYMYIHEEALECMLNKELRYTTSKYPLCSIFRIRKFLERGWHISAGQILKMAWDLNKLHLQNIHVLKDQLVGVDHTYFKMIIDALEKKVSEKEANENPDTKHTIDEEYLYKLINYIF